MKKKQRKAKKHKKQRKAAVTTTAIVAAPQVQVVRHGRTQTLRPEEIALLKRTVAKGTSDDEFSLFMLICRKHKVDPFIGQIHCAKWFVKKHHKEKVVGAGGGEIEVWVGGEQMVVLMGINGYRTMAARSHKDYGGCDEPKFVMSGDKTPAGKPIPATCSIALWKKGLEHPIVASVDWAEFGPKDLNDPRSDFWNRMPKHMLAKVAESHAIRKGYPDLSNIYVEEEMDQQLQDFTEGRQMVESDGRTPSGAPATKDVQTWRGQGQQAAIDAEVERQKAGNTPSTVAEMQSTGTQGNASRQPEASTAEPSGQPPVPTPSRIITVRWSFDKKYAAISGDSAAVKFLAPDIKKWNGEYLEVDDVWTIPAENVVSLEERCSIAGFGFQEILGSPSVPPSQSKPGTAAPKGVSGANPDAPTVGKITAIKTGLMSKKKNEYIGLTFAGKSMSCFKKDLWDFLIAGHKGQFDCLLFVKTDKGYSNVIGIKKIGSREFDENNLPVLQMNEERPKPGQMPSA